MSRIDEIVCPASRCASEQVFTRSDVIGTGTGVPQCTGANLEKETEERDHLRRRTHVRHAHIWQALLDP